MMIIKYIYTEYPSDARDLSEAEVRVVDQKQHQNSQKPNLRTIPPAAAKPKNYSLTPPLTPHTAPVPPQSAAQEHPAPPFSHHYTPGPADAAKWTPRQEYQAWKTPPWVSTSKSMVF